MITFNFETLFELKKTTHLEDWVAKIVDNHGFTIGEINYIFCDDAYLHKLNIDFLHFIVKFSFLFLFQFFL